MYCQQIGELAVLEAVQGVETRGPSRRSVVVVGAKCLAAIQIE